VLTWHHGSGKKMTACSRDGWPGDAACAGDVEAWHGKRHIGVEQAMSMFVRARCRLGATTEDNVMAMSVPGEVEEGTGLGSWARYRRAGAEARRGVDAGNGDVWHDDEVGLPRRGIVQLGTMEASGGVGARPWWRGQLGSVAGCESLGWAEVGMARSRSVWLGAVARRHGRLEGEG
jgi:hypothetical protein